MFDSFIREKLIEICILKLCSMITYDPHNGTIFFFLQLSTQVFKHIQHIWFFSNKVHPSKSWKSSTTTRTYLFPPMLSTCIGPIKSMWRSSRILEVTWCSNLGWDILVCLPIWHSPHMSPSTILSLMPKKIILIYILHLYIVTNYAYLFLIQKN